MAYAYQSNSTEDLVDIHIALEGIYITELDNMLDTLNGLEEFRKFEDVIHSSAYVGEYLSKKGYASDKIIKMFMEDFLYRDFLPNNKHIRTALAIDLIHRTPALRDIREKFAKLGITYPICLTRVEWDRITKKDGCITFQVIFSHHRYYSKLAVAGNEAAAIDKAIEGIKDSPNMSKFMQLKSEVDPDPPEGLDNILMSEGAVRIVTGEGKKKIINYEFDVGIKQMKRAIVGLKTKIESANKSVAETVNKFKNGDRLDDRDAQSLINAKALTE